MKTVAQIAEFFGNNPTQLGTLGKYRLWEHPTRGDTAPIYMSTPDGRLINTGFYDIEDFDIQLCIELDKGIY
jgi:hypothetical protein